MLQVRLHHGQARTPRLLALVDSGADVSAFHTSIADQLGIDLASCSTSRLRGIGGSATGYAYEVEMEIEGKRFSAVVRFVPMVVAILGRHDVFMQFRFAFDQRAQRVYVEPYG